ncbi:MAG: ATP-binding protein [Ignavibacteriaceae bacterium]|jgi:predicted HTH transcriptional regulator
MKKRELLAIIEEGENLYTEFKRQFSSHEKIAKEIIAFANTKGGNLIIGVDDDKSIYGVASEKGEAELIKETAEHFCEPPISFSLLYFSVDHKEIVVVEIPESTQKPHRLQDYKNNLETSSAEVYVRVNDKSVLASKEMIRVLRSTSGDTKLTKYVIGNLEKTVFSFLEKEETISVNQLSELLNISDRRASRTLVKMVRAHLLFIHTKENGENYFTSAV